MGGKEKRRIIEENRVDVVVDVDQHEVDAGDRVENGVDKVNQHKKKSKAKREVPGDGSEFVAEDVKGSVGDENEGGGSKKKKKKRKREVGQDEQELEKVVKRGSRLSEGTESIGAKGISKVPQLGEYADGHMNHGDKKRHQIQTKKEKNKKHREVKKMDDHVAFSATKHLADDKPNTGVHEQNKSSGKNIEEIKYTDEVSIRKKKKKKEKKGSRDSDPVVDNQKMEEASGSSHGVIAKKDVNKKERSKRKKQKQIEELGYIANGNFDKKYMESEVDAPSKSVIMGSEEEKLTEDGKHKKKKDGIEGKDRKKKPRRVSFAEHVEVFPPPPLDGPSEEDDSKVGKLVRGKKFSKEEDELVKQAVYKYIEAHGLGEDGLNMVLNCGIHRRQVKNCWKEIGADLPWRPDASVYHRAHLLFERSDSRTWTPEEYELVRKFHDQHGSDWRTLADALGRNRIHVKDTWRRTKLPYKKGPWSQDEYQKLFDLVNMDLRMKVAEERRSKHGMLLDNIAWGAISDSLGSRDFTFCCRKWYRQLTSPMVSEGVWADTDDYRLLNALVDLDACSMEDVDWDKLVENKSGQLCRKRWNQMVKYIGDYWIKSFPEQVEILSERYCPDLLEAREIYASKPIIS